MKIQETSIYFLPSESHTESSISHALHEAEVDNVTGYVGMRKDGQVVVFGDHTYLRHPRQANRAKKFMQQHGLACATSALGVKLSTVLGNAEPFVASPLLKESLIGKTIEPETAERYKKTVEFDGMGRVQSFRHPLSNEASAELRNAAIRPLTITNSAHPRDPARTERDCLIQMIHLLHQRPDEISRSVLDEATALWMSGAFEQSAVARFFADAIERLGHAPQAQRIIIGMLDALRKETSPAQRNDNMYGRKFDSEVAHALIMEPPAPVLDTCRKIGQRLLKHFKDEFRINADATEAARYYILMLEQRMCRHLAQRLEYDPRTWFNETPEIDEFISDAGPDTLAAMLSKVENGFDVCKIHYLAVHISFLPMSSLEWAEDAGENFRDVVGPARSTRPSVVAGHMKTSEYGNRLANHPSNEKHDSFRTTKSWAYANIPPSPDTLSEFEKRAQAHGHTIVNGASGSANIMYFLSRHIAQEDPDFSTENALLASMMFLVFDGGHSLNEVAAVYEANKADDRAGYLAGYSLDYRKMPGMMASVDSSKAVSAALDTALAKAIEFFDANSYYAAENRSSFADAPVPTSASSSTPASGTV